MRKQSHKREYHEITQAPAAGLRVVAFFEGAKGAIVLLAGCGLLLLIHKDLHQAMAHLIKHFNFNPASKYPSIFLDLADRITNTRLWAMAFAAAIYSAVRFAEAVGLWLNRRWAEWFGLLTGAMYIPIELFELAKGLIWPRVTVFVINVFIVSYLLYILLRCPQLHKGRRRVK